MPDPKLVMSKINPNSEAREATYVVFDEDFNQHANDFYCLAFRADSRWPKIVFRDGFSVEDSGGAMSFRAERGDMQYGAVCISLRPDVAATFPMAMDDGRYLPTWLYAFHIKRAIVVAAAGRGFLQATADQATKAAAEARQKIDSLPKKSPEKYAARREFDDLNLAANDARKRTYAVSGMGWAHELAVLTVPARHIVCAFCVSRKPDSFMIEAIQHDHFNKACTLSTSAELHRRARESVAEMRNGWTPFANDGGQLTSQIEKRQEWADKMTALALSGQLQSLRAAPAVAAPAVARSVPPPRIPPRKPAPPSTPRK